MDTAANKFEERKRQLVALARGIVEKSARRYWPPEAITPDDCIRIAIEDEDPVLFTVGVRLKNLDDQHMVAWDFLDDARLHEDIFKTLEDDLGGPLDDDEGQDAPKERTASGAVASEWHLNLTGPARV